MILRKTINEEGKVRIIIREESKMNDLMKMANEVIKMRMFDIKEANFSEMDLEEKAKCDEVSKKMEEVEQQLLNTLTEEQCKILREYSDLHFEVCNFEIDYMFNQGVKAGLRELNFVGDILGEATVLL